MDKKKVLFHYLYAKNNENQHYLPVFSLFQTINLEWISNNSNIYTNKKASKKPYPDYWVRFF